MFRGTSLGHYAALIRHWLWCIVLMVGICTGITYGINVVTSPVYEASALIQVHDAGSSNNNVFTDIALAQSYALLINRSDVLQAVAQKIRGVTVHQLEAQVSATPLDNTQIIQVRVSAKKPDQAALITNTVVTVFINQQVDHATAQLKDVAAQLYKNLNATKQTADTDQAELLALEASHASQQLIAHQDDVLRNDQINYDSLQVNYDQVQQQLLHASSILTVAQLATAPTAPSSPNTTLNTLVAALLSLLVSVVFVLLFDWMNTTIKTPDDVEKLAQMNPLGSVPFRKDDEENEQSDEEADLPIVGNALIERAFIGISTYAAMARQERQVLLVTALRARAGSSTTAVNLAVAWARSGMRVLLIDANVHHATLHKVFHHPNTSGLTTTLADPKLLQMTSARSVQAWCNQWKTRIPNLWFLPAGPVPAQEGTPLQSGAIATLVKLLLPSESSINETTSTAPIDVVIFDAAPLDEADTLALAPWTDGSLLVIDAGKEQAMALHKAQAMLKRLHTPLLGVVINRQKATHSSYFYARRYLQGEVGTDTAAYIAAVSPRQLANPSTSVLVSESAEKDATEIRKRELSSMPSAENAGLGIKQLLNATYAGQSSEKKQGWER